MAGGLKGPQYGRPTSDLQMAEDRAGPYSLRRPVALAMVAIAARRRRAARERGQQSSQPLEALTIPLYRARRDCFCQTQLKDRVGVFADDTLAQGQWPRCTAALRVEGSGHHGLLRFLQSTQISDQVRNFVIGKFAFVGRHLRLGNDRNLAQVDLLKRPQLVLMIAKLHGPVVQVKQPARYRFAILGDYADKAVLTDFRVRLQDGKFQIWRCVPISLRSGPRRDPLPFTRWHVKHWPLPSNNLIPRCGSPGV